MATDLAALVASVQDLLGRRTLSQQEFGDWLAGSATGGPNANGTYPLTDSTGFVRMLPSPAKMQALSARDRGGVVYPDDFDALAGTGSSHDDYACIQAMFNAEYLPPYPRPTLRPRARYWCSAKVVVDPSRNTLDGNSAQIGWDLKTFTNPATVPNLVVSDPGFDTGNGWIKSANDKQNAESLTYDGAVRVKQPDGDHLYYERGQQLIVPAGQLMTITITMLSVVKNTVGSNTYHDVLFTLRNPGTAATSAASAIGSGLPVHSASFTIDDRDADYAPGKVYTWTVTSSVANPYLRIQSDASFELDSVVAQIVPDNVCMLVRVPPSSQGGNLRGHNQREFRNFKLSGRDDQSAFVDAVLFDTPKYATNDLGQHSRVNWYNFDISDGIGRGLIFQNRTYLSNFHGFRIVCDVCSVDTIAGFDAGENISFVAGNMGGGQMGIRNLAGYALRLVNVSIDFTQQWVVGKYVTMEGCWLENNAASGKDTFSGNMAPGSNVISNGKEWTPGQPLGATISGPGIPAGTTCISRRRTRVTPSELWEYTLSAANTNTVAVSGEVFSYYHLTVTKPLIDVTAGGKVHIRNTLIQQDGNTASRLESPFRVAADGFLDIEANTAYNLDGRAGCLCVGDGRFSFRIVGTGVNRNVEGINKRDDEHNILGSDGRFEASGINIPAFLAATGSGQRRPDRNTVVLNGTGSFTGTLARGSAIVTGLTSSPNSGFLNRELTESTTPAGTIVVDYQIEGTTFTGTATVGSNVITGVTPQPTSNTAYRRFVAGSGIPRGARVLSYTGSTLTLDKEVNFGGSITVTTPNVLELSEVANTTIAASPIAYRQPSDGSAGIMRITSAYPAYEGNRCLEIYKNLPGSEPLAAYIAIPCEPNRGYGSELRWAVPPNDAFSDTVTGKVYIQPMFRRIVDAEGTNPRLTDKSLLLTDYPKTGIPMKTGTDGWSDRSPFTGQSGMWRSVSTSLNSPGLGSHDGFTPEWATHLVWYFSLVDMPRGSSLLIDSVIGNNQ